MWIYSFFFMCNFLFMFFLPVLRLQDALTLCISNITFVILLRDFLYIIMDKEMLRRKQVLSVLLFLLYVELITFARYSREMKPL